MFSKTIIAATAAIGFATSATALGSAKVVNNCDYDAYIRSIGNGQGHDGEMKVIGPHGVFSEQYITGNDNPNFKIAAAAPPGRAIKITTSADVSGPEVDFGYAYDKEASLVWYSLSTVNGNPYDGKDIHISSSDKTCLSTGLGGDPQNCNTDADTILTLCATS